MLGSWFTPRSANQCRAPLVDFFNHAAAKGLCPDNPAASTIKRVEKKQRKRHTVEGLKAIREKSPAWLQNANRPGAYHRSAADRHPRHAFRGAEDLRVMRARA